MTFKRKCSNILDVFRRVCTFAIWLDRQAIDLSMRRSFHFHWFRNLFRWNLLCWAHKLNLSVRDSEREKRFLFFGENRIFSHSFNVLLPQLSASYVWKMEVQSFALNRPISLAIIIFFLFSHIFHMLTDSRFAHDERPTERTADERKSNAPRFV